MARKARGLVTALMLAAAVSARAEESEHGRFRIGPVYFAPKVVLARYGGANTTGYGAGSDLVAESTTVLTPSLDTVLPIGRRLRVKGRASAYLNPFRQEPEPAFAGYGTWGGGELDFGPLTAFGSIGRGRSKERVSFTLDQRIRRSEDSSAAGVALRLGRRVTTSFTRTDRTTTFDEEAFVDGRSVATRLDRESTTDHYATTCALTRLTTLRLSADVIEDRFIAADQRIRSYRYLAGFEFSPLAFVRGRVAAGYRSLAEGQGVPGYTGSALSIAATIPFFRFGMLTGAADRDVTYSLAEGSGERSTFLVNRYRGDLRIGLPLSLIVGPYYSIERARDLGAAHDTSPSKTQRYGGSLFRAFGPSFRVGGSVEIIEIERAPSRPVSYFATAEWTP